MNRFVATANSLLQKSIWTTAQKTLLKNALNSSKIVSVSVLVDPMSGKPVASQNELVVYGSPGYIQLKNSASVQAGDASFEELVQDKKPIAQYVAHELYRASPVPEWHGRKSVDF